MEYIFTDERGVVHFDLYFTYLESVKELFPPHVYAFAANSQHYSLHDRTSLHDAWPTTFILSSLPKGREKSLGK